MKEKKTLNQKLSNATQQLNKTVGFVSAYVKDAYGHPFEKATSENFMQILAGEPRWNTMDQEKKMIINGILMAAERKPYEAYLTEAKKIQTSILPFLDTYMKDQQGTWYHQVDAHSYTSIIAGKLMWESLSDDKKIAISSVLQKNQLPSYETYYEEAIHMKQVVDEFIASYLKNQDEEMVTQVDRYSYLQILQAQSDWESLNKHEQEAINAQIEPYTFEQFINLAQMLQHTTSSFLEVYLSKKGEGIYTEVHVENYEQILSGYSLWRRMSKEQRIMIDTMLEDADSKIYQDLIDDAKEIKDMITRFVETYTMDQEQMIYEEVNADNYEQILSGCDDWETFMLEEQDAINRVLAYQGGMSYQVMVDKAKGIQKTIVDFIQTYADKQKDTYASLSLEEKEEVNQTLKETSGIDFEELQAMASYMKKTMQQPKKVVHKTTITHGDVQEHMEPRTTGKTGKGSYAMYGVLSLAMIALLGKKKKK